MSLLTDLRDAAAAAYLDAIKGTIGQTVTYSQKSGASNTGLYAVVGDLNRGAGALPGVETEDDDRTFTLPKQTGSAAFPPTGGPNISDLISWNSQNWIVDGISADGLGAVYTLTARALKANKMGVSG